MNADLLKRTIALLSHVIVTEGWDKEYLDTLRELEAEVKRMELGHPVHDVERFYQDDEGGEGEAKYCNCCFGKGWTYGNDSGDCQIPCPDCKGTGKEKK